MTKSMIQPLESYRLAQYSVPISCYICGTDNTFDAEYCTHCLAPMALAHQASVQQVQPQMIAVVGAADAGKTVYLGMLIDMLSRQLDQMQLFARGAFSITLQQTTLSSLARCEFPPKTPNEPDRWNWVHCQVRRPHARHPMELIMPDMAGEALLEEVDHPHTFRVIRSFLEKCQGALILVDAVKLRDGMPDHDYFALKLLTTLSELAPDPKTGWMKRPVALILSKADQCDECSEDPGGYAKAHASGLWQYCRERLHCHRFFAAGIAGACAWHDSLTDGRVQVPLRVEPHGIVEPFEWLLGKLKPQRNTEKS